jgi:hypothetical protein
MSARILMLMLILATAACTPAWAEQTQVDHVEYFPVSTGVPDPFHVRRLTVGDTYNAAQPAADSAAVAGFVGVRTTSPGMPLTVGARDVSNLGGALRFLGSGANRFFYWENNTGQLRLITQSGANTQSEKLRIRQTSGVGIFPDGNGIATPAGQFEIGPKDTTNAGGEVRFAGAVNGAAADHPYFFIENNTGQMRLFMQNAATTRETMRVLNDGSTGIFFNNIGSGAGNLPADPRAPLELGAVSTVTNGGRVRFTGTTGNRWFRIGNGSSDFRVTTDNGAGGSTDVFRLRGSDGAVAMAPVGTLATPVNNIQLRVQGDDGNFVGNVGMNTTAPRSRIHVNDSDDGAVFGGSGGSLFTVRNSANTLEYDFFATGPTLRFGRGLGTPAYFEIESGRVGIQASAVRDKDGNAYPSNMSLVIKTDNKLVTSGYQGALYVDGAIFGVDTGTIAGAYMMKVYGSAEATAWSPAPSSARIKTDIVRIGPAEEQLLLAKVLNTPLYHYRLKDGNYAKTQRLGVLVEETPSEMLDDAGQGLVRGDQLAALLAAVKAQQLEIQSLQAEVKELRK